MVNRLDASGPSTGVAIRAAVPDDAASATELRESVAAEGQWIGAESPIHIAVAVGRFRALLADHAVHLAVAVHDRKVVGQISVFIQVPGVTKFVMHVAADRRGRGIGTGAETANCGTYWSWAWCSTIGRLGSVPERLSPGRRASPKIDRTVLLVVPFSLFC
jgi:hypothetical protein